MARYPTTLGMAALACLVALPGCREAGEGPVGFVLVRAENIYGLSDLRADRPIDVDQVGRAACQILSADAEHRVLAEESLDVDPAPDGGFQEVVLPGLPSGQAYLARFLAYRKDQPEVVHQCGASGFYLKGGEKHWVTIHVIYPAASDPGCEALCLSQGECAAGSVCLSGGCDLAGAASDCTKTQCYPELVGQSCAANPDCALAITGLSCILSMGGVTFPGGYCSKSCGGASACPAGSQCTENAIGTSSSRMCAKICQTDEDCRGNYRCQPIDTAGSQYGCIP